MRRAKHFTFIGDPPSGVDDIIEARCAVMSLIDAHDDFPEALDNYLLAAMDTVDGKDSLRCFCCDQKWARRRAPLVFVVIVFPPTAMMMTGVCTRCAQRLDVRSMIDRAIQRQLPGTIIPTHTVGGHA